MSKEKFKIFAKKHPELIKYVNNGDTTWQKLYEIYDIYGDNSSIWDKYIENNNNDKTTFKDVLNLLKKLDMDSIQEGINNIQKTIDLLKNISLNKTEKDLYEAQPLYKKFDD